MSSAINARYQQAGVDIAAGNALVERIKPHAKATTRAGVLGGLGGFGALFDLKAAGFEDALLVSTTDGVGTKLKLAQEMNQHATIGIDLVAMCVNDLIVQGATPLFFLDYYATGKLNVDVAAEVVAGIAQGCQQAGCALVGGETAEMPGMYQGEEYDLAGFSVGAVARDKLLPKPTLQVGDTLLGIASSGLHSNGYSLVRKLVMESGLALGDLAPFNSPYGTLGDALLAPTRIYVKSLLPILAQGHIKALAHITGGGLTENLPRALPVNLSAAIDLSSWPLPPVFDWLQRTGDIPQAEMLTTFNCGLGMILVVGAEQALVVRDALQKAGEHVTIIGELTAAGETRVVYSEKPMRRVKVAVLISGAGSNLQALIDAAQEEKFPAEIVLVISNKSNVRGLERASAADIPSIVIPHTSYPTREAFDAAMDAVLVQNRVELVCLAGFMRVLSDVFVKKWAGKLINIHPSLLPKYKGLDTHARVLQAGDAEHGATVHWVTPELDSGEIIVQKSIPILDGDTPEQLKERVHVLEHMLYPLALEKVARGILAIG